MRAKNAEMEVFLLLFHFGNDQLRIDHFLKILPAQLNDPKRQYKFHSISINIADYKL